MLPKICFFDGYFSSNLTQHLFLNLKKHKDEAGPGERRRPIALHHTLRLVWAGLNQEPVWCLWYCVVRHHYGEQEQDGEKRERGDRTFHGLGRAADWRVGGGKEQANVHGLLVTQVQGDVPAWTIAKVQCPEAVEGAWVDVCGSWRTEGPRRGL